MLFTYQKLYRDARSAKYKIIYLKIKLQRREMKQMVLQNVHGM